jgi:hypothetical protein
MLKTNRMKTIYNCGHHAIEVSAYSLSVPVLLPCVICHSAAKLEQDDNNSEPLFTVGNQYNGYVYSPYIPGDPALFPLILQRKCKTSASTFTKGDRFRELEFNGAESAGKYECVDGRILIAAKDFFVPNPPMPGGERDVDVFGAAADAAIERSGLSDLFEIRDFEEGYGNGPAKPGAAWERDEDDLPF